MSIKLAIYVTGSVLAHGHKRREFVWSPEHGIYLYGGSLIDADKFNAVYARCVKTNTDMSPLVKVIATTPEAAPAPVATIAAGEVTLAQAEAVMERLAPHRLKKKTGPKGDAPRAKVMEVA